MSSMKWLHGLERSEEMNVLVLIVAVFLYVLGLWQLDHLVAPYIWRKKKKKVEVITLPFFGDVKMEVTRFYVLCFICMTVGWFMAMIWFAV